MGTPATRASILEKLVKTGFMKRMGTSLAPTEKGVALATILPEELQSPALTAEWEQKLKRVEQGEETPEQFMQDIEDMITALVSEAQPIKDAAVLFHVDQKTVGTCPRCGSSVVESPKAFGCTQGDCGFILWKNNRFFESKRKEITPAMATAFLKEGEVYMKGLYSQKTGKTYDATVIMEDTKDQYINFKLQF